MNEWYYVHTMSFVYTKKSHKFCSLLKDRHVIWYAFMFYIHRKLEKNGHAFYGILMGIDWTPAHFTKLPLLEHESVQNHLASVCYICKIIDD